MGRRGVGTESGFATYPSLRGRAVLVTGGATGIGASVVEHFARQGSRVAFFDVQDEAARELVERLRGGVELTPMYFHCDLTDVGELKARVQEAVARFGGVDVLVNNAANDQRHRTEDVTEEFWDESIAVNLRPQFFMIQAVLPAMKAAGAGAIVNLGSISWMLGQGGMAAYTACKSAVIGLTRSLARDYGAYGVRVNAVAPGWIMTQRQLDLWVTPEVEQDIYARQCLKRKIQPSEVAEFVVFLASDAASACTNQHYVVDGGWT